MIPILTEFGVAVAAHAVTDAAKEGIKRAFEAIRQKHPDLERRAEAARGNDAALQSVFHEAVGAILAEAGTGSIAIDGATLTALRGITFDHQHGTVQIANAALRGQVIQTGGGAGATGQTHLGGNTSLRSHGDAGIEIGQGAGIAISGDAGIKIT